MFGDIADFKPIVETIVQVPPHLPPFLPTLQTNLTPIPNRKTSPNPTTGTNTPPPFSRKPNSCPKPRVGPKKPERRTTRVVYTSAARPSIELLGSLRRGQSSSAWLGIRGRRFFIGGLGRFPFLMEMVGGDSAGLCDTD